MYPPRIAERTPDAVAYVMAGSGASLTFAELDARSNQFAHLMASRSVAPGALVMIVAENRIEWPVVVAAGMRSGVEVCPVNWHLTPAELAAILAESSPDVIVTTQQLLTTVHPALQQVAGDQAPLLFLLDPPDPDGPGGIVDASTEALAALPATPIAQELLGARVLYSGGSTGRPKAYRQPLLGVHPLDAPTRHPHLGRALGLDENTVFLSPAPNYHAAPFTFQLMVAAAGGTVVCLERFDPQAAIEAIDRYRVTHSQWVPTMLARMLRSTDRPALADSHRVAVTSGAPCPIELKTQITQWWGPVLHEYYGASEGYGHTYVTPAEAATRPGTVGKPLGEAQIRIADVDGQPVPEGQIGQVQFLLAGADPDDAASWKGMGDLGYVDGEGYLYLSGRASFMIVSGGVNVYPEEIESVLAGHPLVSDVAVFGLPDADLGERVHAVVELTAPDGVTAEELTAWCRQGLAGFKVPRSFDFVARLPRKPTGKLNKRELRDAYLPAPQVV